MTNKPTPLMLQTSKELNTQNNRCAEYPLFVVEVDVQIPCTCDDFYDGRIRKDMDEIEVTMLCSVCRERHEQSEELIEDCDDCDLECYHYFKLERQPNLMPGVFLTAKACQEHIDCNAYHYDNPKVYGISVWRNPEMEEVIKFMRGLTK